MADEKIKGNDNSRSSERAYSSSDDSRSSEYYKSDVKYEVKNGNKKESEREGREYERDEKEHVCYAKGTHITTDRGPVAVEDLQVGDLVLTVSGKYEPISWLGHR
ncbi:Hint domain-containing protein, partial [Polynucleobacter alcilacus]|uniref:Hint domain-containing protein n=1 Tax=Polynucleobacter alcilacus TaxID=1819739 RepID=UPI001C0B4D13